jgi:hypothetical protein
MTKKYKDVKSRNSIDKNMLIKRINCVVNCDVTKDNNTSKGIK